MSNFLPPQRVSYKYFCTSQNGWINSQLHQQCINVSILPHPLQHSLLSPAVILAILLGVRCYLKVVLICLSLIIRDLEHFLMCLIVLISLSGNCLFMYLPIYQMGNGLIFFVQVSLIFTARNNIVESPWGPLIF